MEGGISDTQLYFSFSERPLGRKLISPKIMTFFCWVVLLPICHFPSWWKGTFFITRKFFHCVVALPTGLFLAWKIGQDVMMLFLYSQYTNCHKTSESLLSSLSQGILDHSFYDYLHNSIIIFVALLSNCEKSISHSAVQLEDKMSRHLHHLRIISRLFDKQCTQRKADQRTLCLRAP